MKKAIVFVLLLGLVAPPAFSQTVWPRPENIPDYAAWPDKYIISCEISGENPITTTFSVFSKPGPGTIELIEVISVNKNLFYLTHRVYDSYDPAKIKSAYIYIPINGGVEKFDVKEMDEQKRKKLNELITETGQSDCISPAAWFRSLLKKVKPAR